MSKNNIYNLNFYVRIFFLLSYVILLLEKYLNGVKKMNKIFAYILPLIAFIILVILRELLEISNTVFLVILLLIVISAPVLKVIAKNRK